MSRHEAYFFPVPSLNSATWRGLAFHWSCVYSTRPWTTLWPSSRRARAIVSPRTISPRSRPTCWRPLTDRPEFTTTSFRPFTKAPTSSMSSSAQCIGDRRRRTEGGPLRLGKLEHGRLRAEPALENDKERGRADKREAPGGRHGHRGVEERANKRVDCHGQDYGAPAQAEELLRPQERGRQEGGEKQ